jgi:hypothetical protein
MPTDSAVVKGILNLWNDSDDIAYELINSICLVR